MKIVGLISLKGGVGKSTLVVLCAQLLAERGFRVLIVDTDIQNSTTFKYDPTLTLANTKNLANVFMDSSKVLDNIETVAANIDLIPSAMNLIKFGTLPVKTLRLVLKKVESKYDFVLLDTAPAWDALVKTVYNASDLIISPVEPSEFNLKTVETMSETYDMEDDEKLPLWHILPCAFNLRVSRHAELLEQYKKQFPNTMDFVIPQTENVGKIVEGREFRKDSAAFKSLSESLNRLMDFVENK